MRPAHRSNPGESFASTASKACAIPRNAPQTRPLGGMADAGDLKSLSSDGVPVRAREGLPAEKSGDWLTLTNEPEGRAGQFETRCFRAASPHWAWTRRQAPPRRRSQVEHPHRAAARSRYPGAGLAVSGDNRPTSCWPIASVCPPFRPRKPPTLCADARRFVTCAQPASTEAGQRRPLCSRGPGAARISYTERPWPQASNSAPQNVGLGSSGAQFTATTNSTRSTSSSGRVARAKSDSRPLGSWRSTPSR